MPHRPRIGHLAAALVAALLVAAFPASRAAACSCAAIGSPIEGARAAIDSGQLVFIGTVTGSVPAGRDANLGGQLIRYAFAVEAASQPTGPTVEVRAIGGDGGASCGIEFGAGERWMIAAGSAPEGYSTHLCAANVSLGALGAGEAAALAELLSARPSVAEPSAEPGIQVPFEVLVVAAGIGILGLASAVAFRRRVS